MKERPILFSGEMVRAILDGRKTQTRRVLKPEAFCPDPRPVRKDYEVGMRLWVRESNLFRSECGGYVCRSLRNGNFEAWTADHSVHYQHDDRVKTWEDAAKDCFPLPYSVGGYCAEKTGQKKGSFTLNLLRCDPTKVIKAYSGNTVIESSDVVFRRRIPAIHMPRWASRISLEVLSVRVERLQDITSQDAVAEGSSWSYFHSLWDSINASRGFGWDKNPFVWVIEFKSLFKRVAANGQ